MFGYAFLRMSRFTKSPEGVPLCRRPLVSEPGTGAIFSVFWASVFAELLYVLFRFNVSWGVQKDGIFEQFYKKCNILAFQKIVILTNCFLSIFLLPPGSWRPWKSSQNVIKVCKNEGPIFSPKN